MSACPLFNTHFVREGTNNYAIVQGDEKVVSVQYNVSERPSTSSISSRTFSGKVDRPQSLYQWDSVAEGGEPGQLPPNNVCFTFPIIKGSIYFIQLTFDAEGQQHSIHYTVDPNKRRLTAGKKRDASSSSTPAASDPAAPTATTASSILETPLKTDTSSSSGAPPKKAKRVTKSKAAAPEVLVA